MKIIPCTQIYSHIFPHAMVQPSIVLKSLPCVVFELRSHLHAVQFTQWACSSTSVDKCTWPRNQPSTAVPSSRKVCLRPCAASPYHGTCLPHTVTATEPHGMWACGSGLFHASTVHGRPTSLPVLVVRSFLWTNGIPLQGHPSVECQCL